MVVPSIDRQGMIQEFCRNIGLLRSKSPIYMAIFRSNLLWIAAATWRLKAEKWIDMFDQILALSLWRKAYFSVLTQSSQVCTGYKSFLPLVELALLLLEPTNLSRAEMMKRTFNMVARGNIITTEKYMSLSSASLSAFTCSPFIFHVPYAFPAWIQIAKVLLKINK